MYVYIYIEREMYSKNVTNANCFRFGDPFLISRKNS